MASNNPSNRTPMYPQVYDSNPETSAPFVSNPNQSTPSKASLYPTLDMKDLVENLFPDSPETNPPQDPIHPTAPPEAVVEILLTVSGAIVHLIDKQYSVELAIGELSILQLRQGNDVIAILIQVSDEIQWPLAKDQATVKLDDSHYFFSFRAPKDCGSDSEDECDRKKKKSSKDDSDVILNYGLTIASKGQETLLKEFDKVLEKYSNYSVQKVANVKRGEALDGSVANVLPADLESEKKEVIEERSVAYWTTLAPNVEDYSGSAAKLIASGSGQLVKGILWCGDVTVDRLKWGNEFLKKRMTPGSKREVSPETVKRIQRVKKVTKMTEKVATGVLSGAVKVSGFFSSSVVNSKVGKKFFGLLPGEIILASLDGFSKVCDAVEVAGKNVMSTSSTVTTGLVDHRYGEDAAKATNEGLDAAGHAIGTAWAVFKIRKALNPKSVLKPTTLVKSAAKNAAEKAKSAK